MLRLPLREQEVAYVSYIRDKCGEIYDLVLSGLSYTEIAEGLNLDESFVREVAELSDESIRTIKKALFKASCHGELIRKVLFMLGMQKDVEEVAEDLKIPKTTVYAVRSALCRWS